MEFQDRDSSHAAVTRPRAISLERASEIAGDVRRLIESGQERVAWEHLRHLHPADIGTIVAGLPHPSREAMVRVMSPETVVWMLRQMNPVVAGRVGARMGSGMLSAIFRQVHPQTALETLRRLPHLRLRPQLALETLRRLRVLRRRHENVDILEALDEIEPLSHSSDTAGSLMVIQFPTVGLEETAEVARDRLRQMGDDRTKFTHILAVNENGEAVGQISMADLALSEGDTPVREISTFIIATVSPDTPLEECSRLRRHYNLTQLPVVEDGQLIGVILPEALLGATVEEDTRQMMEMGSVAGEMVGGPLSSSLRTRLPWLTVNLGTTFLAAATIALFESTLVQLVVLAAFLPVVAGQGGIGGTQTLTLIVRAIALGELVGVGAARILARELVLGVLHGIWLGALVAVIAIVWKQNVGLGVVLGLAMFGNMIIAGSVGAAVPLLLRRLGVDPAVASAVVVTTITDVAGFILFLGIASAAINFIQ